MSKTILISSNPLETRVAIIKFGKLSELYIEREERIVGSIYKARVTDVIEAMQAAFVDIGLEKSAFLPFANLWWDYKTEPLTVGRELLVQVVRGPVAEKGAKVSTRIAIAGKYLVLLVPKSNRLVGISTKIEDEMERRRLRREVAAIKPEGLGLIVRTEAQNKHKELLIKDLQFLQNLWGRIQEAAKTAPAPSVIFKDLRLIYRAVRDFLDAETEQLLVDSIGEYQKIIELLDYMEPNYKDRICYYSDATPLFERYNIDGEFEKLFRHRIWLPSGGFITIEETEAFTAIDVNTGRFTGTKRLVDIIFETNLEAAQEIARQIRLRDLGGMIIIDFIDMQDEAKSVYLKKSLEEALKEDRARPEVIDLGAKQLIGIVRRKIDKSISQLYYERCEECRGSGKKLTAETVAVKLASQVLQRSTNISEPAILITSSSADVLKYLIVGGTLEWLETTTGKLLFLKVADTSEQGFLSEGYRIDGVEVEAMAMAANQLKAKGTIELEIKQFGESHPPKQLFGVADGFIILLDGIDSQALGKRAAIEIVDVRRGFAMGKVIKIL